MGIISREALSYIKDIRDQVTPRTFDNCLNLYSIAIVILKDNLLPNVNNQKAFQLCTLVAPLLDPEDSKKEAFEAFSTPEKSIEALKYFEDNILDVLQKS